MTAPSDFSKSNLGVDSEALKDLKGIHSLYGYYMCFL